MRAFVFIAFAIFSVNAAGIRSSLSESTLRSCFSEAFKALRENVRSEIEAAAIRTLEDLKVDEDFLDHIDVFMKDSLPLFNQTINELREGTQQCKTAQRPRICLLEVGTKFIASLINDLAKLAVKLPTIFELNDAKIAVKAVADFITNAIYGIHLASKTFTDDVLKCL